MAEETASNDLLSKKVLPNPGSIGGSEGAHPSTDRSEAVSPMLHQAPGAVKRSMPMALSITLGILLAAAAGIFFYRLTWFILVLYLSFVIATILEAPLQQLRKIGIRRGFAAVIIMVGGLAILGSVIYFAGNSLGTQFKTISSDIEHAPEQINKSVTQFKTQYPHIGSRLQNFDAAKVLGSLLPTFSTVMTNALSGVEIISWLVVMFFLVLYMLIDGADHLRGIRRLLPKERRLESTKLYNDVARAHRGWALASVINVASSTCLATIGLAIIGVPAAFIVGFIAGLGELVPNIGPIAAAIPALLLTLIMDPDKFLYVVGMFLIVWTIQGYGISPFVMKFSIELPVLVTIIAVLIFGTLFGFLGIFVAVPLVADMVVLWRFIEAQREHDSIDYDAVNDTPKEQRQPWFGDAKRTSKLVNALRRNPSADSPSLVERSQSFRPSPQPLTRVPSPDQDHSKK